MGKKRTPSSARWLKEHHDDEYVLRARKENWRSRAIYKLSEMDEKDLLFKQGMTVVDLGAAPGSWSQYAMHKVGHNGKVFALDILPMSAIAGVDIITGDFREDEVLKQLETLLDGRKIDFSIHHLKPGGDFLMKIFQGEGFEEYLKLLRENFDKVLTRKPKASRARSSEIYLLARGFKGKEE